MDNKNIKKEHELMKTTETFISNKKITNKHKEKKVMNKNTTFNII